ncbi:MAG: helix-turn-helix domain-containing protein [Oscillospiraceae bacterium]|nr:helix-turn-helix domain-containing protein [Oscillospiraceae bacterium]
MATGERIHFFRKKKGMKLRQLGQAVGFPESNADVRMAQYESGSRTPKADITSRLAEALDVSPRALTVPDIDSYTGLMHTLFTLEDIYGLRVTEIEGEIVLHVDVRQGQDAAELHRRLCAWREQATKLEVGEITKEDYDRWRYRYPELDTSRILANAPPQGLSDIFMDNLQGDE